MSFNTSGSRYWKSLWSPAVLTSKHTAVHPVHSPIQHLCFLRAPSLGSCFSLICHILPPYLLGRWHLSLVWLPPLLIPFPGLPWRDLKETFSSHAHLSKGGIYCFVVNRTDTSSCKNFFPEFIDPLKTSIPQLSPTFWVFSIISILQPSFWSHHLILCCPLAHHFPYTLDRGV